MRLLLDRVLSSYWDSDYDLKLFSHKVSLNLLYVQTVSDVEQGWILCSNETRNTLANLQARGDKKQVTKINLQRKKEVFCSFVLP